MSTELVDKLATELEIPEGVTVTYKKPMITVQGPLGKTWKSFKKIPVTIEVTDGKNNQSLILKLYEPIPFTFGNLRLTSIEKEILTTQTQETYYKIPYHIYIG